MFYLAYSPTCLHVYIFRRILERLAATPGLNVIGGVRNIEKAAKDLSTSSTVVRGAMVQKVAAVYIHMYIYTCTYAYTCIYAYTNTNVHVHMYT